MHEDRFSFYTIITEYGGERVWNKLSWEIHFATFQRVCENQQCLSQHTCAQVGNLTRCATAPAANGDDTRTTLCRNVFSENSTVTQLLKKLLTCMQPVHYSVYKSATLGLILPRWIPTTILHPLLKVILPSMPWSRKRPLQVFSKNISLRSLRWAFLLNC
jgi:hypothetical protein